MKRVCAIFVGLVKSRCLAITSLFLGEISIAQQPVHVDPIFNPGVGPNTTVYAIAEYIDGKVVIGGAFDVVNGINRRYIARLNQDGSLDSSFQPSVGANDWVRTIIVQTDGNILIGGDFTEYNGVSRNRIAQLVPDGGLNGIYNPRSGADLTVYGMAEHSGHLFLAGIFIKVGDQLRAGIAQLTSIGQVTQIFVPQPGANLAVNAVVVQPDGKVIIGGAFSLVNGVQRNRIARLNSNGSTDGTFNPNPGVAGEVLALAKVANGDLFTRAISSR